MKKPLTTLAAVLIVIVASTSSYAQSIDATIAKARIAAQDCIRESDYPKGLQIVQTNTLQPCGDGTYSGTVTFSALGRCPGNDYTACTPAFFQIATVTIGCGNSTDQVVCFQ